MEHSPPPPLPARVRSNATPSPATIAAVHSTTPSSARQPIRGIDTLRPVTLENDYVDTNRLPGARNVNSDSAKKDKKYLSDTKKSLKGDRVDCCTDPPLPPRKYPASCRPSCQAPPPLLPRQSRSNLQTNQKVARTVSSPLTSHSVHTHHHLHTLPVRRHTTASAAHLQPSVVVVLSDKPTSFGSTLRKARTNIAAATIIPKPTTTTAPPTTRSAPVLTQPQSLTTSVDKHGLPSNSIICSRCGECRCASCTDDRPLPERWLCDGNCRCSADSVVDIASCMCVVKGLYKMCGCTTPSSDNQCSDDADSTHKTRQSSIHPCDCTGSAKCLPRWTGMALLSACFPCLLCYLPLRGGVKCAEACYNSACCRERGCQCDR